MIGSHGRRDGRAGAHVIRFAAGILVAASLVSVAMAPAAAAGRGGRIVWTRNAKSNRRAQIVSARPDGGGLLELTHPGPQSYDIDAQISPDGSEVVLERDIGESAVQSILVGADGGSRSVLDLGCVDPCVLDSAPTWFGPDRLAFTPVIGPFDGPNNSARSAVLHTALLNGSDPQRLSEPGIDGTFEDYHAHVSPDGSYVVFTRVRNDPFAIAAYRMDVDGTHVHRLTPWNLGADLADLSPATSGPTEDLVVFETYGSGPPRGKNQNIATVPATCAPLSECRAQTEYVTHHQGGRVASFNPAWSPSGGRLAYTLFKGPDADHRCCVGDIWTADADGSHRKPVSTSPRFEYRPDWGPAPQP